MSECKNVKIEFKGEQQNKPPLGLRPKRISDRQRAVEILEAMLRYTDGGAAIPSQWFDELIDIQTKLLVNRADTGESAAMREAGGISDIQVCQAYADARQNSFKQMPFEALEEQTGARREVCLYAIERAEEHGYIKGCASYLLTGWLTKKGEKLLRWYRAGVYGERGE